MMDPIIVHSLEYVVLFGGSPTQFSHTDKLLEIAQVVVAADSGADSALDYGIVPQAVIGDMDSISQKARDVIPSERQHFIAEQDSTDFEKCLSRIDAPAILALGVTGGRLDHQLAACTTLARYPDRKCILIGEQDICFLAPLEFAIDLPLSTIFSLYPLGPVTGTSTGLQYPIDGIDMSPMTRVGTSNSVTGPVRLRFDARAMLILMPVEHLQAALAALMDG